MSRIFDALNRQSGRATDPVLASLLEDFQSEAPAVQALEAPEAPVGQQPSLPDSAHAARPARAIRTLSLSIPADSPLLPSASEDRHAAEQYRLARTRILQHPLQPHMIVVSSAGPQDGKTLSSINLAGALALQTEGNVLLVDADFRRSDVHNRLGIPASPGLSEVLAGASALDPALVRTEQFPNLYILPAGAPPKNPTELLDSSRWRALATLLRAAFKFVIVDSTPIAAVADYDLIEAVCDGVVVVARPDHTMRKVFFKALEVIPEAKLIGVLLNSVPEWFVMRPHDYGTYYYERNAVSAAACGPVKE